MGWLLELLFESIKEMCSQFIIDMMDVASSMFTEILSCNLNLFEELFGVAGNLYRDGIMPIAVMILLMILVWQLFKGIFSKITTSSEDPIELILRSAISLFMIVYAKDIVNYILNIVGTPYHHSLFFFSIRDSSGGSGICIGHRYNQHSDAFVNHAFCCSLELF